MSELPFWILELQKILQTAEQERAEGFAPGSKTRTVSGKPQKGVGQIKNIIKSFTHPYKES